jgi:predicted nuclease of predicted toxin-antitoxin system
VKIKFLADEDLRRAIVLGLRRREPSVSFLHAFQVGAAGKDDPAVLQIAANEGRMLVSHDVQTMPRYFGEFIAGQSSPGLILIPQRLKLTTAIEGLLIIWLASEAEEWVNRICYLPL